MKFKFALLICVLVLFNVACWYEPSIVDSLVRRLDLRLWPTWYFPVIAAVYGAFWLRERRKPS